MFSLTISLSVLYTLFEFRHLNSSFVENFKSKLVAFSALFIAFSVSLLRHVFDFAFQSPVVPVLKIDRRNPTVEVVGAILNLPRQRSVFNFYSNFQSMIKQGFSFGLVIPK